MQSRIVSREMACLRVAVDLTLLFEHSMPSDLINCFECNSNHQDMLAMKTKVDFTKQWRITSPEAYCKVGAKFNGFKVFSLLLRIYG